MTLIRGGHLIDPIEKTEYPVFRDPCPNRMLRRGLRHFAIVDAKYKDQLSVMYWWATSGKPPEKGYPISHRNKSGVRHSFSLTGIPWPCPIDPTKLHLELLEMRDSLEILELVQAVKNLPPSNWLLSLQKSTKYK